MLLATFCWETLSPGIHVDISVTRATYLNITADKVHPFKEKIFPRGSGLYQQDNASFHTVHTVQALASKLPRTQSDQVSVGCAGTTSTLPDQSQLMETKLQ